MRIILMHNPAAGRGEHEAEDLMALLAKAGHEATYQSTKDDDFEKALARPTDLILAAGGDGTVGKVARHLVGRGGPLSVLPLGTANNLARTLGFIGSSEELIAQLKNGRRRSFDVGRATGPWGERYFFEGAGGGLLPDYLADVDTMVKTAQRSEPLSQEEEITRHVSMLRRLLAKYTPGDWQLSVDGEDISDRYILFEAMNIRSVGPVLRLAPKAETADGHFDLVAVKEADRAHLKEYLEARLTKQPIEFPIPARKFRHLRIVWEDSPLHFDDKLWPGEDDNPTRSSEIEITVEASALEILSPAREER